MMPHSSTAEEAVLGSVLYNPDVYHDCAAFLVEDDFYIHRNRFVWVAFVRMFAAHTPVDILTVCAELDKIGKLEEVGGTSRLTELVSKVYDSFNAEHYARIVEGFAIRRKMIYAATETVNLAHDMELDPDTALTQAHQHLQAITPAAKGNRLSLADRILEQVTIAQDHTGEITGMGTGIKALNTITDGWKGDDLVLIAARPGMGKTGLLLTHTREALRLGKCVALFSMEMGDISVGQRLLAQEKNIDLFNLRRGRMTDQEYSGFVDGLEWLRMLEDEQRLTISETSGLTPEQVHAQAKKLHVRGLCDLVVVDYIQLMDGKGDSRQQQVGYCSRGLKRVAMDLHIPVLSAAQISREIEKRSSAKPTLADLRESGDLEQDADLVIFIWQQGERIEKAQIDPVNITVAKHRNGPIGDLAKGGEPLVQFIRKSTKFMDA